MDRVLLLLCLCVKYAMFAEVEVKVKDNETLIYHWDVHHKIYYYCQFGTREQINRSYEQKCFRRNKNMQHILPDGTVTFPYAKYGSEKSFVLKCGDIQHAELHSCSKLLYKTCRYTCKGSSVTRDITCELRGPTENVTAQWSVDKPCSDIPGHFRQPVTQPISLPGNSIGKVNTDPVINVETTRVTLSMTAVNSISSSEFQTTPATDVETTTSTKFLLTVVLASTIPAIFMFGVIILVTVLRKYLQKRRRRKSRLTFMQISSPEKKISYNDSIIIYSELLGESKRPLMVIEGEDNLQKSASDTDANTSEASSEAIQDVGNVNEKGNDDVTRIEAALDTFESMGSQGNDDGTRIAELLDNFESMGSRFSSWENTKKLIEDDKLAESPPAPPRPEQCCASVTLLLEQPRTYRRNLRAQLEVISDRLREQTLIGYMEQHVTLYGYQSCNELKLFEQTYQQQTDEKVSDVFLRVLAGYDVKIGYIMKYFYEHKNWDAIRVILIVHTDCPYCEMFRRQPT